MFERLLFRKKILKMVTLEYEQEISYYQYQIIEMINSCNENTSEEEMNNKNSIAIQKYYEKVLNNVCSKISEINPTFKYRFLLCINSSVCGYETDINSLAAGSVYAIAYWVVTNKEADSKDCIFINHYVYELKNKSLEELDR